MHSLKRLIYALEQQHGPSIESRRSFNRLIGGGKRKLEDSSGSSSSSAPKKQKSNSLSRFTPFKEEKCPICLERIGDDLLFLPCGHVTHPVCLANWLHTSNNLTCPTCRQDPAQLLPRKLNVLNRPQGHQFRGQTNQHGQPHGKGILLFPDGNKYEGDFQHRKRHGRGKIWNPMDPNEGSYEGEWQNGMPHGKGIMLFPGGKKYEEELRRRGGRLGVSYEGEWQHGRRHGKGKMKYKGAVYDYEGEWQHNRQHGKGKMKYKNGAVYDGEWQSGKQHGTGTITDPDGTTYVGDFQIGKRHGKGIFQRPNGKKYAGTWTNDKRDGKFIITDEDGNVEEATWKNGNRIEK